MERVSDVLVDIVAYFVISGTIQAAFLLAALVLLLPALLLSNGPNIYKRIVIQLAIFNFILLLWGCLGNAAWAAIARDRYYIAGDPLVEWFAYFPFGPWAYDYTWGQQRGHLTGGATLLRMRILWGSIALLVWGFAYLTHRVVLKWAKAKERG